MNKILSIILFSILFISCEQEKKDILTLSDPDIQKITEYQDTKNVKELIKYFVNPNKQLRKRACIAFGSIQDSSALNSLYTMLEEDENIAQAAAYAIGQIGSPSSIPILQRILTRSMNEETRYEFFIALGKCGGINENYYLVSNYNVGKDARGTAWSLFYLSRDQFLNNAGLELAVKILENESDNETKLGAAHAISRSELDSPWMSLLPLFIIEKNDDVKIALANGLKGMSADSISPSLLENVKLSSPNCQLSFIRSTQHLEETLLIDYTTGLIENNANINLQIVAAEYLALYPDEAKLFLNKTSIDSLNWRVRSTLIKATLSINNDELINYSRALYNKSSNLYEKGELLIILSSLPGSKDWLMNEISMHDSIVSTYGMEAVSNLIDQADNDEKLEYAPFLLSTLSSSNDAAISYSAMLLRDSVFISTSNSDHLKEQQAKLSMPKQTEAYLEIEKTIQFYAGIDELSDPNPYNHPIKLDSLAYLESIKGFLVSTTKGEILMEVNAYDAPGTVMSIARLVSEGYYDGKLYHRVVPNFVIQTGCPNGDGWGSQDYTMRSVFTKLRYTKGAVGMASAGKDTESCQWFISHSPTPHLNGRYTIFAYVTQGMDVVQNIEVGDRILAMKIVSN